MGQHDQRRLAQRAGQMHRRIADGDHDVAGVDQRGQCVDVVKIIDVIDVRDFKPGIFLQR